MDGNYCYVWEYIVADDVISDFESLYGPDGGWVQLFSRDEGYLRTELLRDRNQPGRYLTIDYWVSSDAHRTFRARFAREFAEIDLLGEELTDSERFLGEFDVIGSFPA